MCLRLPTSLWQPAQESASVSLSVSRMERLLEGGKGLDVEEQKQRTGHRECRSHSPQPLSGLHSGRQLWSSVSTTGPTSSLGDLCGKENMAVDMSVVHPQVPA